MNHLFINEMCRQMSVQMERLKIRGNAFIRWEINNTEGINKKIGLVADRPAA